MIINTEYKIIYLSNCKCASTTIRKHFWNITDKELVDNIQKEANNNPHITYKNLSKCLLTEHNIDISTFFLFSTIRNPWERIVSLYNYAKPDKNGVPSWALKRVEGTSCSFKKFVFSKWGASEQRWNHNKIGSLTYACRNVQDMFGEDYSKFKLYKSEELNVNKIMDDINNPILEEKVGRAEFKIVDSDCWKTEKEKRDSLNYREYYDDELQEVIANHYKLDIEIGEYEF